MKSAKNSIIGREQEDWPGLAEIRDSNCVTSNPREIKLGEFALLDLYGPAPRVKYSPFVS